MLLPYTTYELEDTVVASHRHSLERHFMQAVTLPSHTLDLSFERRRM